MPADTVLMVFDVYSSALVGIAPHWARIEARNVAYCFVVLLSASLIVGEEELTSRQHSQSPPCILRRSSRFRTTASNW